MRLIIDTDPAMGTLYSDPEDGMAILYALASPEVTVEGLTLVQGNVPVSHSWPNVRHLLDLAGHAELPVHVGAAAPRRPELRDTQTKWLNQREHMEQIVPTLDLPDPSATAFLCETVLASPGEITLVAIGPLTNVAAAIEADDGFAGALAGVVSMGGTVAVPGNITPAAEFNYWMDPESARIVFDSGVDLTMIGLDVCHRTTFERDGAEAVRASGSPLATFLADTSESWIAVMSSASDDAGLHLYDSLAVAAAIEPDLCTYRRALVEIETGTGPAQGMTVTHSNEILRQLLVGRDHNATVAIDVDTERFAARFAERVLDRL
jgi:purine nucleosidase